MQRKIKTTDLINAGNINNTFWCFFLLVGGLLLRGPNLQPPGADKRVDI